MSLDFIQNGYFRRIIVEAPIREKPNSVLGTDEKYGNASIFNSDTLKAYIVEPFVADNMYTTLRVPLYRQKLLG